jgi:YidC/Oxa1 family membrane protein insertase
MEKRTVVAFALSFLVLMAWSYLFAPKQEPLPPKPELETRSKEAKAPDPTPATSPKVTVPSAGEEAVEKKFPSAETKGEEQEIHVETPLYHAIFSNVGLAIRSFKLKNYRLTPDPNSPLVELVSGEKSGESPLGVYFDHPSPQAKEKFIYQVKEGNIKLEQGSSPRELTFSGMTSSGVMITQAFRFYPDKYPIDLIVTIQNDSKNKLEGRFKATLRNIPPKDSQNSYAFLGLAVLKNNALEEIEAKEMKEDKSLSGRLGWIAYESDYFMTAVIPEDEVEGTFLGRLLPSGILEGTLTTPSISLTSPGQTSSRFTLYLGPRDLTIVKDLGKRLELAINFGWTDVYLPIAKPLLYTLRFFNQYVNNYGLSIILLTVLIKILFWPLTHKSYKSMKEMQKIQPLMARIREKYKDNKEQMNKEMMALYKTYKVNPMGGCLPMVIQIPVFFALFRILGSAIELRHAPFLLWINDLSAPDRLFNFPFEIPYMTPPSGIPVLTLLMGASMYIQQKMTPTPGDQTQAKIMMLLPVVFTVMFINFPSGLVLYWLINNILSIGQQYRILKKAA